MAMPWNNKSRPNAFVSFSNPSRSTRMTDVKLTQTPTEAPNVARSRKKYIIAGVLYRLD